MKGRFFFPVILSLFLSVAAFAQSEGNPENWCRNGLFPRESGEYKIAKIKAANGERIYFYGDDENCPKGKNCRQKSYLIPNNEVIVSRTFGNFACSWYQPAKGSETVGWIPLDKLEFLEILTIPGMDIWSGKWSFYDSSIEIAKTGTKDVYKVTGNAFWKGLGDNIHIGELDGEAKLAGAKLKYGEEDTGEYDCKVTMQRVGNFLIVADNMNCGGVNVTFSGVYQRKKAK